MAEVKCGNCGHIVSVTCEDNVHDHKECRKNPPTPDEHGVGVWPTVDPENHKVCGGYTGSREPDPTGVNPNDPPVP